MPGLTKASPVSFGQTVAAPARLHSGDERAGDEDQAAPVEAQQQPRVEHRAVRRHAHGGQGARAVALHVGVQRRVAVGGEQALGKRLAAGDGTLQRRLQRTAGAEEADAARALSMALTRRAPR